MLKEKLRWIFLDDMLRDEYRQCIDEGRDVEKYLPEIEEILEIKDEKIRNERAGKLLVKMEQSPVREDFRYCEPTAYDKIVEELPADVRKIYDCQSRRLEEHIQGGWYGRIIGCVLGIPVEGWSRQKIQEYLRVTRQTPLTTYLSASKEEEIRKKFGITEEDVTTPYDRQRMCWIDCLDNRFPVDDDINYTTVALKILERAGREFDSADVAEAWLLGIPSLHACTAERAAIRNLLNGILPPESAVHCNPYREWIGAQIRGDFFGYINPGNPFEAAHMAYKDAAVSHTKNGVYGEMFIAALISLCFVNEIPMLKRIELALKQIPPKSRLAASVAEVCRWYEQRRSFEDVVEEVHNRYDERDMFDWCLTIPNAMLVVACLLWKDNFDDGIAAAVTSGFDTDCNGATIGSVFGISDGFESIRSDWYESFEKTVYTSVHGYYEIPLDELVKRTVSLI